MSASAEETCDACNMHCCTSDSWGCYAREEKERRRGLAMRP